MTKILNAGIELFRQYGFKTITMDDIARSAGISKKTLYQHFSNKGEVVNETVAWYKGHIADQCCKSMEESENAIEAMVRIMGIFDQINRKMNPLAMLELERFFPETFKQFRESMLARDVEQIKTNMERGISEGLYRPEINPEFMAKYRIELSLIMYHSNLLLNDRVDLQFIGHEINEHFLYGIMTPKGEKLYQKYKEKYFKQVSKI
ncbi:MAG: TetR/AcrR family transcriptional regulator [Chitinophagales bacterium]|nr:TetR/AcrR family transcriptional regulator [Chitinophagaceae bacterium]MCB9065480.1 TetR/AcrR family transcriptional regulator [Chitinophagales bacterium]